MTHEFSIGDIVKIRDYDSIPQDKKTKSACGDPSLITPRKSALCGKTVEIVDRLYSEQFDSYIYRVKEKDADRPSRSEFTADFLEPIDISVKYVCEVEDGGNVIIASIYEEQNGQRRQVAKGNGHVIHEGALGFTQALSYALKRAYQRLQDESSGGGY
jgi:hypothetical protein